MESCEKKKKKKTGKRNLNYVLILTADSEKGNVSAQIFQLIFPESVW